MTLKTTSTSFLNTSREDDSTTCPGSLFWSLTIFSEKKFTLISNLNLSWCNLRPLLLILLLVLREKSLTPQLTATSFQGVVEGVEFSLSLPFSRLNNPYSLSCSSSDFCSIPLAASLPFSLLPSVTFYEHLYKNIQCNFVHMILIVFYFFSNK